MTLQTLGCGLLFTNRTPFRGTRWRTYWTVEFLGGRAHMTSQFPFPDYVEPNTRPPAQAMPLPSVWHCQTQTAPAFLPDNNFAHGLRGAPLPAGFPFYCTSPVIPIVDLPRFIRMVSQTASQTAFRSFPIGWFPNPDFPAPVSFDSWVNPRTHAALPGTFV